MTVNQKDILAIDFFGSFQVFFLQFSACQSRQIELVLNTLLNFLENLQLDTLILSHWGSVFLSNSQELLFKYSIWLDINVADSTFMRVFREF